ncbi:exo-alpha-sialidase [Synoicihabitans lomoniglobus]|uniref:Exo-alpha-sialidase n=1 Tax=Synoicihabitans lomoniglobus TaxID=2909285 RepID=A0AAE9ZZH0_9BACT|nr:exo-alpha-sialidase [Opitutaceae bacterium LMO-M01]WED63412.1 exo-alpha-sialidase [Opitutaceae bacterium LMO-M01]
MTASTIRPTLCLGLVLATALTVPAVRPDPVDHPDSPLMLAGDWVPADTHQIKFDELPLLPAAHAVISDVRDQQGRRVNQHNYLVFFDGRYWAMWSDGPGVPRAHFQGGVPGHDRADQHVFFATSRDGLDWGEIGDITGAPDSGYGWIARGFWVREGKLLALASRYEAPGYAGPGLSLHAFELVSGHGDRWQHRGLVLDDSMNNFSPKQLPGGDWLMTRRDQLKAVSFMRGGVKSITDWRTYPVIGYDDSALAAEEPYWWQLADGNLVALFRDNLDSGYLFRAFSTDEGRTWTRPVRTNFPDAKSKFNGVQLPDGRFILVNNSHPDRRDPMTLAISEDGLVFDRLLYLVGGRHIDYPHVMEHDGFLFVAFAGAKQTVEVLRIRVADLPASQPPYQVHTLSERTKEASSR